MISSYLEHLSQVNQWLGQPPEWDGQTFRMGTRIAFSIWELEDLGKERIVSAIERAREDLAIQVMQKVGSLPHTVRYEIQANTPVTDYDATRRFTMTAIVSQPVGQIHELRTVVVHERPKYRCVWCGGHTFDDERGNCAACGGPRL